MTILRKRATIYLDPKVHKILKMKAVVTSKSFSEIINEAVLHELAEDQADLAAFDAREKEGTISYEQMLKELKSDGKI